MTTQYGSNEYGIQPPAYLAYPEPVSTGHRSEDLHMPVSEASEAMAAYVWAVLLWGLVLVVLVELVRQWAKRCFRELERIRLILERSPAPAARREEPA
jgi:hypothetical protein